MLDFVTPDWSLNEGPRSGGVSSILHFPVAKHHGTVSVDKLIVTSTQLLSLESLDFSVEMEQQAIAVLVLASCKVNIFLVSFITN